VGWFVVANETFAFAYTSPDPLNGDRMVDPISKPCDESNSTESSHLRDRIYAAVSDIALLLCIPVTLAAVYYLVPLELQRELAFNHADPDVLALWTSALVHEHRPRDGHLTGNIIGYVVVVAPMWLLYIHQDARRSFWKGLGVLFVLGPVLFSVASYAVFNVILGLSGVERGFSGVVSGLVGILMMSIVVTVNDELPKRRVIFTVGSYLLFLIMTVVSATLYPPIRVALAVSAFFGLSALVTGVLVSEGETTCTTRWLVDDWVLPATLLVGIAATAYGVAAAFPVEFLKPNRTINIVSHGTGLVLGVIVGGYFTDLTSPSQNE
jgi:hypothetical protein